MVPVDKLQLIQQRFQYLEAKMNDGVSGDEIAKLGREYSDLKPVIDSIEEYFQTLEEVQDATDMLEDPDMRGLAEEELPRLKARLPKLESELQLALLPKDAADARPAIIEIRPGTGGEEAAYSRVICCGCINGIAIHAGGILKSSKSNKPNWVASKKLLLM